MLDAERRCGIWHTDDKRESWKAKPECRLSLARSPYYFFMLVVIVIRYRRTSGMLFIIGAFFNYAFAVAIW